MTMSAPRTRLLVVHPDDADRTFLRRRLARLGYEVVEAADHAQALWLVAHDDFGVAIVDLQTRGAGGEEGLDLVRGLRESGYAGDMPILAIGESGATEDAAEALALGADDCLLRPV